MKDKIMKNKREICIKKDLMKHEKRLTKFKGLYWAIQKYLNTFKMYSADS